jgi:dTDP-4-amino-4,6-dideoxygalactose transaminase
MLQATERFAHRKGVRFVDLTKQNELYRQEWISAISSVIETGRFVGGEQVAAFEQEFASYCGSRHGVGTASGSDALRLALLSLGIGGGDEVMTVSNTFISTADAIVHAGATPVFVDVDPDTYTMNPDSVKAAMGRKVKAIIPVHLYGQPADMSPIIDIAEEWDIPIVEDAAQAHGASYNKGRCGSLGRMACFSFYPSKNLGAFGDAGLITTDDETLADRLRMLRQYGEREKNHHELIGFNSRLDPIQATVLRRKLKHLDEWNRARRQVADMYDERLGRIDRIKLPSQRRSAYHVFHIYAIGSEHRDSLRMFLNAKGIETGVHYPIPIHLQPAYSRVNFRSQDLNTTKAFCERTLSLPMYPELSAEDVDRVCKTIQEWNSRQ